MEFIFEPSLNFLAVKEPSLYELFQSSKPAVPADAQIAESAVEAYICSEKENSSLKVYLAFWEISRKTTRIYTPKAQPCGNNEYQDCLDAARKYLTDLGFAMEQVNLNYSTAMRQVIWGAIKIFKAPKSYAHAEAKKKGHESPPPARQVIQPEPIVVPPVVQPAVAGSETDQAVKQLSAELQDVRSLLSARELEAAIAAEQLIQANNTLIAAELRYSDQIQDLEKERDTLSGELDALKKQMPELDARLVDAQAKNDETKLEFERLLAIEKGLKADAENELQLLSQEKDQIERVATAALNSARGERKELLEKVDSLELENRRLKKELETQLAELHMSEEKAKAEVLTLKKELVLRKRVHVRELAGLRGELRKLIEEQAALETGCQMIEAFAAANEAPVFTEASTTIAVEPPVIDDLMPEPFAGEEKDDQGKPPVLESLASDPTEPSPFQVPEDTGHAVTEFMLDSQLTIVPCAAPEDLVALYESSNKVQTALDGFKTQKSGGYICAVNRNGNPEIFLLWEMLESNQAVLYTPRSQPKDEHSFQQILQDALFYFDSVGFMMSPVDLSVPVNRSNAISKIQLPQH
ncbi:hypothetical protein KI809_13615 [Geobacter pelophilus]|uniref:SseB protein N-terminal domain-containing protein n=1 Tax=Geoanaerobacter pelophilus TaxID=60036 RepID=A0AAW4L3N5_9BACT|nr:hypothetical protein [Geoanaerobacter pelophilus]MBT0665339.1 hypothetical protein [Geoanaerobacter pelophilus]